MANCFNCGNLIHRHRAGAKYCNDSCKHKAKRIRKNTLNGSPATFNATDNDRVNATFNSNATDKTIVPLCTTAINSNLTPKLPMTQTEEHLYRRELEKQDLTIAELKLALDKKEQKHEILLEKYNDLQVKHNTVEKKHEQELSGVELSKKNFMGELMLVIKDKEAMDGIANVVSSFKSGETKSNLPEAESDDFKYVKEYFLALSKENQTLLGENIYAYSLRPDMLLKQNQELKSIINT